MNKASKCAGPLEGGRILVPLHDPHWGGPKVFALNIGQAMREAGWPWVCVLPQEAEESASRLSDGGIEVIRAPIGRVRGNKSLSSIRQSLRSAFGDVGILSAIIRENNIRIVQAVGLHNFQGALAARSTSTPLVWQIHGTALPTLARAILSPVAILMADAMMTNGVAVGNKFPGLSILDTQRFVFYAPVDYQHFRPDDARRRAARQRLGADPGDIVLGTVGNRVAVKGHDILLRAAAPLLSYYSNLKVRILGTEVDSNRDWYKLEVLHPAQSLNLMRPGCVDIIDPGRNVPELLNGFDIFALPSRAEGVPLVIGEAMASALPIVSFDVGAIYEVVSHGDSGFIVPAGDEKALSMYLETLVTRQPLRSLMGARGRERITSEFSIANVVRAHVLAYESAIRSAALR